MKRKIMCMGILSLLLLTGLVTVSASKFKTNNDIYVTESFGEPDIKVTLMDCWWEKNMYTCKVENAGTAPTEQDFVVKITDYNRLSEDAEWEKRGMTLTYVFYAPLEPGEEKYTQPDHYLGRPCITKSYFLVEAVAYIEDSNSDNNVDTLEYEYGIIEGEEYKSYSSSKLLLFKTLSMLFNKLPRIRNILFL